MNAQHYNKEMKKTVFVLYKIIRSLLVTTLLLLVVIYSGIYIFLSLPSAQNRIRQIAEKELTALLRHFTECGVQFVSKTDKKRTNTKSSPHSRPDWINITPSMPFYSQKKQILAIWKKLGYSMTSLDTRVQREFGSYSFVWLKDEKSIIALLTDLQKRERAFDKKNKKKTC